MTGLEYVKYRLRQDFGETRANKIEDLLDGIMEELITPDPLEKDISSDFQLLLNDSVYPYLACSQAMQDAGVDIRIANRYVRKICDEMPEEMKVEFMVRNAELP